MKYLVLILLFGAVLVISAGFDGKECSKQFVQPKGWPPPVYDLQKNKVTEAGFDLGRRLFYDPILSRNKFVSCATCHVASAGFAQAGSVMNTKGKRDAPSICNLAWNTSFMWDGGINNLEMQPLGPITSPAEMDNTLANVVKCLDSTKGYRARFYAAFGDSTITGQRVLKAMAQFLALFESFNSKYDKYTRQEPGGELTVQETKGLALFWQHCQTCHKEPLFSNYSYQNIGLSIDPALKDYGRMAITRNPDDSLKFKVPSLRNVAVTYPYMHDGRFRTLMEVMDHYTDGIVESPTLAADMRKPIVLNRQDKKNIIAFLGTLTDTCFLNNSAYALINRP